MLGVGSAYKAIRTQALITMISVTKQNKDILLHFLWEITEQCVAANSSFLNSLSWIRNVCVLNPNSFHLPISVQNEVPAVMPSLLITELLCFCWKVSEIQKLVVFEKGENIATDLQYSSDMSLH